MLSFLSGKSKKVKEDLQSVVNNSLVNCRMETAKMQSTQEHSKTALLLSFGAKYTMGISPCVRLVYDSYHWVIRSVIKIEKRRPHVIPCKHVPKPARLDSLGRGSSALENFLVSEGRREGRQLLSRFWIADKFVACTTILNYLPIFCYPTPFTPFLLLSLLYHRITYDRWDMIF